MSCGTYWCSSPKRCSRFSQLAPDWVAAQQTDGGEVNWIIETKGRVREGTEAKDAAITERCRKVYEQTGDTWRVVRVNQTLFGQGDFSSFQELVEAVDAPAKGTTGKLPP